MRLRHTVVTASSLLAFVALVGDAGCSDSNSGSEGTRDAGEDAPPVIIPLPDGAPLPPPDGSTYPCDLGKPFGAPALVPKVNTPGTEFGTLSHDELTIYTSVKGVDWFHIYSATRLTPKDDFGVFRRVPNVNNGTTNGDYEPHVSADGLELYLSSDRGGSGSTGQSDLFVATRTTTLTDFGSAVPVANVNTEKLERAPALVSDKSALYFASDGYGGPSGGLIVKAIRSGGAYTSPQTVPLGTTTGDGSPVPSGDDRILFFGSGRNGARGGSDIWFATRAKASDVFDDPTNARDVAALNGAWNDRPTWLSPDGCRLYLESDRPVPADAGLSEWNLYVATRPR
ncbi:hypothetical protein [Pendulispora albinea]|uniref:Uncharacterized protein n=1 Tax=Pendulispora albinea TaxID=2741071 RepID=A0ABZ2LWZ4_9BACT